MHSLSLIHTSQEQFAYQQEALIRVLQSVAYVHDTLNKLNPEGITHTSKEQFAYQQGALITVLQHEPCLLVDLRSVSTIDL